MSLPYLLAGQVVETEYRGGSRVVKATQGEACMLNFGARGWLMGYKNRLWVLNSWGGDRYYRNWPWTVEQPLLKFDWHKEFDGFDGVVITGSVFERGGRQGSYELCQIRNATHCLVRLQRWFRELVLCRKARRLSLAMALHPRLGQFSWLGALDMHLVQELVLAGT